MNMKSHLSTIRKRVVLIGFALFLVLNYAVILGIAIFNYMQFGYIRREREERLYKEIIQQQDNLLASYNRQITNSILQLFNSPLNIKLRHYDAISPIDKIMAMRELNAFVTGAENLISAYVYSRHYGVLSSDDNFSAREKLQDFQDTEAVELLRKLKNSTAVEHRRILVALRPKHQAGNNKCDYVFTFTMLEDDAALMVNVDMQYLKNIIKSNPFQAVCIKNSDDKTIIIYGNKFQNNKNFEKAVSKDNLKLAENVFGRQVIFNNAYLCYKTYNNILDLQLTYYLPEQDLFADVIALKKRTIKLAILILFTFILLHICLWHYVINPFAEAVEEVSLGEHKNLSPACILRKMRQQQFLQLLLTGEFEKNSDFQFVEEAQKLQLPFTEDYCFLLLLPNIQENKNIYSLLSSCNEHMVSINFSKQSFILIQSDKVDATDAAVALAVSNHNNYKIPKEIEHVLAKFPTILVGNINNSIDLAKSAAHLIEMQQLNRIKTCYLRQEKDLKRLSKDTHNLVSVSTLLSGVCSKEKSIAELWQEFNNNNTDLRWAAMIYVWQNLAAQLEKRSNIADKILSSALNELLETDFGAQDLEKLFLPYLIDYREAKQMQHLDQVQELSQQVERYIKDNLSDYNLSLKMVAGHFNLNPTYLGKLFKEARNITISAYITRERLQQAAYLLKNTDLINKQICEKIGIENSSYFYALFKKFYGITPGEFKDDNWKNEQNTGTKP